MANLTEDEIAKMLDGARRDETERCALLNERLADIHEASATRTRKEGSYEVRALWPFGAKIVCVKPGWERNARIYEAAAHSLRTVARCVRAGHDPRKIDERLRQAEKINLMQQVLTPEQREDIKRRMRC